jgi:hypothetical protein
MQDIMLVMRTETTNIDHELLFFSILHPTIPEGIDLISLRPN